MSFIFRETTAEDKTYIYRLNYLADVFGDETKNPDSQEFLEATRVYVDEWDAERGGVLVIDEDLKNPAGGAWLVYGTDDSHGEGYVAEGIPEVAIAVESRYRGSGLGTELLKKSAELARDRGAKQLSLCVHDDNPRARALYERLGFKTVKVKDNPYTVMVLDLT
ncbi:GNAT family N-acetyltransferase [Corynebacterium tapiri]|uniref:GNAT family N-acetyltransferase n=1 Tax=Corynebacterium tapiri TaxID=1448266 RepID=A0A5C4U5L5_9CORY|nr:GNAT family N-acetyltransferase [Corynebacterium tapiri]TNL99378.1 GNAT family N-acetyltransferase [Corynebacterium tapiri]